MAILNTIHLEVQVSY